MSARAMVHAIMLMKAQEQLLKQTLNTGEGGLHEDHINMETQLYR